MRDLRICASCGKPSEVMRHPPKHRGFYAEFPEDAWICQREYRNSESRYRYANDPEYRARIKSNVYNNPNRKAIQKKSRQNCKETDRVRKIRYEHSQKGKDASKRKREKRPQQFMYLNRSAKKRKIPVHLTFEEFNEIRSRDCFYCRRCPSSTCVGIDRIVSSIGKQKAPYSKGNCVACCGCCNLTKGEDLGAIELLYYYYCKERGEYPKQMGVYQPLSKPNKTHSLRKRYGRLINACKGKKKSGPKWVRITYDEFCALHEQGNSRCHYCTATLGGSGYSLDRKDARDQFYSKENCVPCCGVCNTIKGEYLSYDEMKDLMKVIQYLRAGGELPHDFTQTVQYLWVQQVQEMVSRPQQ